jgi:magnesium-transporting ATPase (P-type)
MFIGYYTPLFESAISPWTTLGPLAIVISVSLAQEAYTDAQRHRSDKATNYHPCVVLKRADEVDQHDHLPEVGKHKHRKRDATLNDGKDVNVKIKPQPTAAGQNGEAAEMTKVPIAFESVFRMNIHAGDLVVVRNREMIPVDLILLASSNEGGSAYIETSSIDGETNLKLRNSPHLPSVRPGVTGGASNDSLFNGGQDDGIVQSKAETLKQAIQRVANMSLLGHPDGVSALLNPANTEEVPINERSNSHNKKRGWFESFWHSFFGESASTETRRVSILKEGDNSPFIATLTSEPPNTHVNNYSGKLTLPPMTPGEPSENAPLNAENILLRGAMLRNTEWVVGVACFTGADTKLVMNSVATPSKFSQLDMLINRTVVLILAIMIICVCSLGGLSLTASNKEFDNLWYAGFSANTSEPWPYFNLEGSEDIASPKWDSTTPNYLQNVFLFVTMLSNFVPLSLYVSVEIITVIFKCTTKTRIRLHLLGVLS